MSKNRHHCKKKTWFSVLKETSLTKRIFAGKDIEYLQEKDIRVLAGKRY